MMIQKTSVLLKSVTQRLLILLLAIAAILSFSPGPALAHSAPLEPESTHHVLLARAASSRFAAQVESEGVEPRISEKRLEEMRQKRREWQSEASAAAETETKFNPVDESIGEEVKDRLNLEEITQENEIVDKLTN
jgi:hypothetical protein